MNTPRWYMVNKDGMATLCTDKSDAEKEAEDAQSVWPHMGPHRAVQLVEVADVEAMRAGYAAARLESESLRKEHADELTVAYMCGASREKELAAQQEPSCTSVQLAEMVLSDCGHSSNYVPLLERVAARIDAHVERCLESKKTTQQEAQEPVAWYVTGCGRLLDEDEAKAEARHIGGAARAIPLYTAPQADSVQDLQPVHDAVTIDLLNERVAYLERKLKEADSVLEDAARLDWLDQQCEAYGFQDIHEGNRWEISGPYANVRVAIDAERAAQEGGE